MCLGDVQCIAKKRRPSCSEGIIKRFRYVSDLPYEDSNINGGAPCKIFEAICARDGYKVYSHEAFTAYLKEKLNEEANYTPSTGSDA